MVHKKREDVILVRVSEQEKSYLAGLAKELGLSLSELLRTSARYSANSLRRKHIKEFVAKAQEIKDPFDAPYNKTEVFDYTKGVGERIIRAELQLAKELREHRPVDHGSKPTRPQSPEAKIDDSDIKLVDQLRAIYPETEAEPAQITDQMINDRIDKIFWYIDETDDSKIPIEIRNDLRWWRENPEKLKYMMGAKPKQSTQCLDCQESQQIIDAGYLFNPRRHARLQQVYTSGKQMIDVWRCMICLYDFDMRQ